eukprot:TRINITY_DN40134_c0_g1_i1.p1 TRINITY_DN40134_c0_g1~~TRINITY_DN40134_c0_g1_i1.p1  ORF type:complete len:655 (-),score=138.28 TRINITY_DN40134_c0_g1_i1:41-1942(-)
METADPSSPRTQDRVRKAFREWDRNKDGLIDKREFKRVLQLIGATETDIAYTFENIDSNRDGGIDCEEWIAWLFSDSVPEALKDIVMTGDLRWADAVMRHNELSGDELEVEECDANFDEREASVKLARVISDTIGGPAVETNENLLRRCDSMLICFVNDRIREEFPQKRIEPRAVFDNPTVSSLVKHLGALPKKIGSAIRKRSRGRGEPAADKIVPFKAEDNSTSGDIQEVTSTGTMCGPPVATPSSQIGEIQEVTELQRVDTTGTEYGDTAATPTSRIGVAEKVPKQKAPAASPRDDAATPSPSKVPFIQLVGEPELRTPRDTELHSEKSSAVGNARFIRRTDGMECLLVPGGTAWIGDGVDGRKALPNEQPCHKVVLSSFLMDVEPVSMGAYVRFLNTVRAPHDMLQEWFLPREDDPRAHHVPVVAAEDGRWALRDGARESWPMIMVTWFGANAYSLWAHGRNWREFRLASAGCLPTEAQWEYAARGADVVSFPWGDAAPTPALLNACWSVGARAAEPREARVHLRDLPLVDVNVELGLSRSGLRHMAGNVWQWCRDTYDPAFYSSDEASERDAWNAAEEGPKSERGGSWVGPPSLARSSYRRGRVADAKGRCLGFRCCTTEVGEVTKLLT